MERDTLEKILQSGESPVVNGAEAVFVYRGHAGTVYLAGDYNRWELEDRMESLEGGELWYIRKQFPENSRFDYKYIVDGKWITDPLNKNATPSGGGLNSTLIMPGYRSDYEGIIGRNAPRGTVLENQKYLSKCLGHEMNFHVYLPPGFETGSTSSILFAMDGSDYLNYSKINLILDYMIEKAEIPKLVAFRRV